MQNFWSESKQFNASLCNLKIFAAPKWSLNNEGEIFYFDQNLQQTIANALQKNELFEVQKICIIGKYFMLELNYWYAIGQWYTAKMIQLEKLQFAGK